MKIFYLLLLIGVTSYSQVYINVATEPRLDNSFNYDVKVEYINPTNLYAALGRKSTNSWGISTYINLGPKVETPLDGFMLIPQIELGYMEMANAAYVGGNLQFRYNINEYLFLTAQGYLSTTSKIGYVRYNGTLGFSLRILNKPHCL